MAKDEVKKDEVVLDTPKVLKDSANAGRKIKRSDRVTLEIVKATKHYAKGQIVEPHRIFAEELIKNGIAKEVK